MNYTTVDSPIGEDQLSSALEQPVKRIKEALRRLSTRYTESGSGIDLRRAGDGWRFYTRDRYAPFVEKLLLDGQPVTLDDPVSNPFFLAGKLAHLTKDELVIEDGQRSPNPLGRR